MNVVFNGHEHFYERIKPQKGVQYFIAGASGKLRRGDISKTGLTAVGYDQGFSCSCLLKSPVTSSSFW